MTEPLHDSGYAFDPLSLGQFRPRDHDHGQAQRTGGVDLGARAIAAGIAGDDPRDASRAHHLQLAIKRERSARHDYVSREGQGRFRWIDESQRVGVLRPGREWRNVLAPDSEEDARRGFGKSSDRSVDVSDLDPVVDGRLVPRRSLQCNQWRPGFRASRNRVAAYLGGKGMRRIDHMRDGFAMNVVGKPDHAAEAANPGRQRLIGGRTGAAAIGIDGRDARARDCRREQARIGCSAQNEGARHG